MGDFSIRICSDLEYENMVADICWKNNTVATITQENDSENMEIELCQPSGNVSWNFPLDEFINTLKFAKKELKEMN